MKVTPSFSVLTGFNDGQPIIDSREATTKVRIANGQTLVIGGLRQRRETENARGVPGVKNWKHVGALFRDHDTSVRESELLVFLKPEICEPGVQRVRECMTRAHLDQTLERLPVPTDESMIPYCGDKYCPLHHPRPRVTGLPAGEPTVVHQDPVDGSSVIIRPVTVDPPQASTGEARAPQAKRQSRRLPTISKAGYRPNR